RVDRTLSMRYSTKSAYRRSSCTARRTTPTCSVYLTESIELLLIGRWAFRPSVHMKSSWPKHENAKGGGKARVVEDPDAGKLRRRADRGGRIAERPPRANRRAAHDALRKHDQLIGPCTGQRPPRGYLLDRGLSGSRLMTALLWCDQSGLPFGRTWIDRRRLARWSLDRRPPKLCQMQHVWTQGGRIDAFKGRHDCRQLGDRFGLDVQLLANVL